MLRNLLDPLRGGRAGCATSACCRERRRTARICTRCAIPGRERHPRDEHENFYWLHEDYVREATAAGGLDVHDLATPADRRAEPRRGDEPAADHRRSTPRSAARRVWPFSFPGGSPRPWEAVDTRLVADALVWGAIVTGRGRRDVQPDERRGLRLARPVAVARRGARRRGRPGRAGAAGHVPAGERRRVGPDRRPTRAASDPDARRSSASRTTTPTSASATAPRVAPPPAFVSTVKIKQAGFCEVCDTEVSFRYWLRTLIERKVLPPSR